MESTGNKAGFNKGLYTFHNGGFVEEWDRQLHVLERLSLNDALTAIRAQSPETAPAS